MISLSIFLLVLTFQSPEPVVIQDYWGNGLLRVEYEQEPGPAGKLHRHGDFKRWYESGQLAEKGPYRVGEKVGTWVSYFENGETKSKGKFKRNLQNGEWRFYFENGRLREEGSYRQGRRVGEWAAWTSDEVPDSRRSGTYEFGSQYYSNGSIRSEGDFLDGQPHGYWKFWWSDGTPQLCGEFVKGKKHEQWQYWHFDGVADLNMQSGIYSYGVRTKSPVESISVVPNDWIHESLGGLATEPLEAGATNILNGASDLSGREAVPTILNSLRALDLKGADDASIGAGFHSDLAKIFHGEMQSWESGISEAAILRNEMGVRRWTSLWLMTKDNYLFWDYTLTKWRVLTNDFLFEVPLSTRLGLVDVERYQLRFEKKPDGERRQAVKASLSWLAANQQEDGHWRANQDSESPNSSDGGVTGLALLAFMAEGHTVDVGEYRDVVRKGLVWLMLEQNSDGYLGRDRQIKPLKPRTETLGVDLVRCSRCRGWGTVICETCNNEGRDSEGASCRSCMGDSFPCTNCDGMKIRWSTTRPGVDGPRESHQQARFDNNQKVAMYSHVIATMALAEAAAMSSEEQLKASASQAVAILLKARNPYGAWRYTLTPDGASDTSISCWVVCALKAAEDAGVEVPPECFEGAQSWVDSMTNKNYGRVGYAWGEGNGGPGSRSSRLEGLMEKFPNERGEALTAAALWASFLMIDHDTLRSWKKSSSYQIRSKQANLVHASWPYWDEHDGSIDLYYWYYATLAMHEWGGRHWKSWSKGIDVALLGSQRSGPSDQFAGSWDPVGAWGSAGGRVYSTAMATMALQVEYRYKRLWAGKEK